MKTEAKLWPLGGGGGGGGEGVNKVLKKFDLVT